MIENIVASFSGGKSSAMMVYLLEQMPKWKAYKKHYVFANTGRELSDTIIFIRDVERDLGVNIHLIEANINEEMGIGTNYKVIPSYDKLDLDGEPFRAMVKKYGYPSVAAPHCTRELKVVPIQKFIKNELGLTKYNCYQAIGYRADEPKRLKQNPHYIYPLYELGITKEDVNDFFNEEYRKRFALRLEDWEGNCDFCVKKSWGALKSMVNKHPRRVLWWDELQWEFWEQDPHIMFRGLNNPRDLMRAIKGEIEVEDNETIDCTCGNGEDFF